MCKLEYTVPEGTWPLAGLSHSHFWSRTEVKEETPVSPAIGVGVRILILCVHHSTSRVASYRLSFLNRAMYKPYKLAFTNQSVKHIPNTNLPILRSEVDTATGNYLQATNQFFLVLIGSK